MTYDFTKVAFEDIRSARFNPHYVAEFHAKVAIRLDAAHFKTNDACWEAARKAAQWLPLTTRGDDTGCHPCGYVKMEVTKAADTDDGKPVLCVGVKLRQIIEVDNADEAQRQVVEEMAKMKDSLAASRQTPSARLWMPHAEIVEVSFTPGDKIKLRQLEPL